MLEDKLVKELLRVVPPGDLLRGDLDLFTYSCDGSHLVPGARPDLVVKARSLGQAAAVLKLAFRQV